MTSSSPPRLLLISGSARTGSWNGHLVNYAGTLAASLGAQVTAVDLRALDLPVYDGDLETQQGVPAGARELRRLFAEHDGLLLASPEYNAFPTPLLINSFDWLSRVPAEGDLPNGMAAVAGKPVGLLAASPGALGGIRAMPLLRIFLSTNFGMLVVPEQFGLGQADQAFNADGQIKTPAHRSAVERVAKSVMAQAARR
jgi:NAD(P)H-dependent FMN reductase